MTCQSPDQCQWRHEAPMLQTSTQIVKYRTSGFLVCYGGHNEEPEENMISLPFLIILTMAKQLKE